MSKSSSPNPKISTYSKTHNNFRPIQTSPKLSTKLNNMNSPPSNTEISSLAQFNEYSNKIEDLPGVNETPQMRESNRNRRLKYEKSDANLFKKYRDIREKCLINEIKSTKLLNELKEEIKSKGSSTKSLTLSFEILSSFNVSNPCNEQNPLEFVRKNLRKFIFLEDELLQTSVLQFFPKSSKEIFKTPLIFIIKNLCEEFSHKEKDYINTINNSRSDLKNFSYENQKLKEKHEILEKKLENYEKEAKIMRDQETSILQEKNSQYEIERKHLINEVDKMKKENNEMKKFYENFERSMRSESNSKITDLTSQRDELKKKLDHQEKELETLKDQLKKFAAQQKDLMIYLKHLKEKVIVLETKSSGLMNENQMLKIRAASAWEELTPRPSLVPIFQILSLEPELFKGKSSKQMILDITDHFTKNLKSSPSSNILKSCARDRLLKIVEYNRKSPKSTTIIVKSTSGSRTSIENTEEDRRELRCLAARNKTLPPVDEIRRDYHRKLSIKCITVKRKILLDLEKAEDVKKARSLSPTQNNKHLKIIE